MAGKKQESDPHYTGHRQRLRDRFTANPQSLPDYELLELLLFGVMPRRDVKPIAKALIEKFGSLAGVLNAELPELVSVNGISDVGAISLLTVRETAARMLGQQLADKPVISNWQALIDYCRASIGGAKHEQFRILFLNKKNILIADELQQKGTVDHTPVYTREVIKRALELGASAIILVHNHPSGDTRPSTADVEMTREIADAAGKLGIVLHDHIIVSATGHTSFKSEGILEA